VSACLVLSSSSEVVCYFVCFFGVDYFRLGKFNLDFFYLGLNLCRVHVTELFAPTVKLVLFNCVKSFLIEMLLVLLYFDM